MLLPVTRTQKLRTTRVVVYQLKQLDIFDVDMDLRFNHHHLLS